MRQWIPVLLLLIPAIAQFMHNYQKKKRQLEKEDWQKSKSQMLKKAKQVEEKTYDHKWDDDD